MTPYRKVEYAIMIGFKGEHLAEVAPVVERLKEKYPEQKWYIANSKFEQYTFLLIGFAKTKDEAHRIGLAVVRKHLPSSLNLLYWIRRKTSIKEVVKEEK